jgi:hypothetical protein
MIYATPIKMHTCIARKIAKQLLREMKLGGSVFEYQLIDDVKMLPSMEVCFSGPEFYSSKDGMSPTVKPIPSKYADGMSKYVHTAYLMLCYELRHEAQIDWFTELHVQCVADCIVGDIDAVDANPLKLAIVGTPLDTIASQYLETLVKYLRARIADNKENEKFVESLRSFYALTGGEISIDGFAVFGE